MVIGIYENDLYNKEKRNQETAWVDEYNCAGFALGTFNWLLPYDEDTRVDVEDMPNTDLYTTDNFTKWLLEHFDNLRLIDYPSQAKDNEEVIGMRIDLDGLDFHFIRRKLNKKWYHKRGHLDVEKFNENVFNKTWCNRYNSEIIFFAKKLGKIKKYEDVIKGKETLDTISFM